MTMLGSFDCDEDEMNVLATTIYRRMRSNNYTPNDIIYGTVYIGNESDKQKQRLCEAMPDIHGQASIQTRDFLNYLKAYSVYNNSH